MANTAPQASMEDLWRDATARFKERTGKDVDLKPPKTMEDCIKDMQKNFLLAGKNGEAKKAKANQYGLAILKCLKLLGGVAGAGAEMASGSPATLCFNALSILLDIPEKLENFREQIDGLFEVLEPSLSVFKIYEKVDQFDEIEPELIQAIHKIMIKVVDICALMIELRSSGRWRSFKNKFKVVVLEDDKVKDEIEKLQELTQGHYSVQATQTLKVVLDTKKDIAQYLAGESERNQYMSSNIEILKAADDIRTVEDASRKHLDNIKRKLGISDSAYKFSKDMCDLPRKDCVPNTASWFMDLPEFLTWANKDDEEAKSMLILTGAPNTGKSVTLSAMAHHLRSTYEAPARQSPRALVAGYFFPNATGKDSQDMRPIETALKCIACQIAEQDSAYAKTLSQACDSKSDESNFFNDAGCQELWDFLRVGSPKGRNLHYLILDGLGGLPVDSPDKRAQKSELLGILRDAASSQVRILLSVRRDTVQGKDLPPYSNIEMEEHTASDIQAYIEKDLQSKDLFQDSDDNELKEKILTTLVKQVRGNFNKVRAALDNIRDVVAADGPETEIDRILEAANMNEKEIFLTMVGQMEDKLTKEEIDELNELLLWVMCGRCWFTVEKLNAALILRFQRKGTLRLKKKLDGKYSGIFGIRSQGAGVCVVDEMEELLITKRNKPRSVDDTPTFTATITITKGDARSVQSFLWSLSQKMDSVSRDAFGFEQMAEGGVKDKIHVNEVDGYFAIVSRTFNILSKEPSDESKVLCPDLLQFLPQHLDGLLEKATGYDELTQAQKQEIGEGIFSLFVSGETIERHWDSCDAVNWHRDPDEMGSFRRWLDDPAATGHLGRLDREWLKEIRSSPNPNQELLSKIMKTMARRWFCDRELYAPKVYGCLKGCLEMPPPKDEGTSASKSDEEKESDQPAKKEMSINDVGKWCNDLLGPTTPEGAVLRYERLGETFLGTSEVLTAISAYNLAIARKTPSDWTSHQGLAKALAQNEQYKEACEEMDKALGLLEGQELPDKTTVLNANYICLADWYLQLKDAQRSIEYAKRALELTPGDHRSHFKLLSVYLMNQQTQDAVRTLRDLLQREQGKIGTNLFGSVLDDMADDVNGAHIFGACLKALIKDAETWDSVLQELRRAGDRARKDNRTSDLILFLLYEGIFRYRRGESEAIDVQPAIRCWDECMEVDLDSSTWNRRRMLAYGWACGHHFDQARAFAVLNHEKAQFHVQKMQQLVDREASFRITASNAYLSSYHVNITKDREKARQVLKTSLESAVQLLSDDDPDNDWEGYYHMACVLTHSGDVLNALTAFSLLFPKPFKTNVVSWILEFDERPVQNLSDKLIKMVDEDCPSSYLQDQLNFLFRHIEGILPAADADGNDASKSGNDDAASKTTDDKQGVSGNNSHDTVSNATEDEVDEEDEKPNSGSDDGEHTTVEKGDEDSGTVTTSNETRQQGLGKAENEAPKEAQTSSAATPVNKETSEAYQQIKSRMTEWFPCSLLNTFWYKCSGPCGKKWGFEDALNMCKHCYDTAFCNDCLAKVKTDGFMMTSIETRCNKDHEWFYMPKWDREGYLNSLKKRVYVGGRVDESGKRIGGELVSADEWLSGLKKDWDIAT